MIHRRAEIETSHEVRATTYLLASFLTELDKSEIETYQAFADLNKSMMLSVMSEILTAQGTDPNKAQECKERLGDAMDKEIHEFGTRAHGIVSRSEVRIRQRFEPELVEKYSTG